jgi:hypothetical protein
MNRRFFLLGGLAALSACATAPIQVPRPPDAELGELEAVYGVTPTWRGLTLLVATHGCTRREDLTVFSEPHGEATALAFGRRRVETCPAGPRARLPVHFTWRELGLPPGRRFYLLNPLRP